jgi:hypothetical protein
MHALVIPILEFLPRAMTYRVGPDRLCDEEFADAPWPVRWVAYWYRDHTWCPAISDCRCWEEVRRGRRGEFAGDGVAVVAYADDRFGLYALVHGNHARAMNWPDIAARLPRLTWEELADYRVGPLEFDAADGSVWSAPPDAAAVWAAVDAARTKHIADSGRLGPYDS